MERDRKHLEAFAELVADMMDAVKRVEAEYPDGTRFIVPKRVISALDGDWVITVSRPDEDDDTE